MARRPISIDVSPRAGEILETLKARGLEKKRVVELVLEWFAALDASEQAVVLGFVHPGDAPSLLRLAEARRAEAVERSDPAPVARATGMAVRVRPDPAAKGKRG